MAKVWVATGFGGPEVLEIVDVEVAPPGPGEVTIQVRAVGMNPADGKRFGVGPRNDPAALPLRIGFEVAGVLTAIGPDTELASGGGAVGDAVIAFRVTGGYSTALTVPAKDVFAKPAAVDFPEAANLLLAGTTAAEMLHSTGVGSGDTILVHGASGAVGVSVLQQAVLLGARVIGTSSSRRFDVVRSFGAEPVEYGDGLEGRVRALLGDGESIAASLDTVGTDEAIDVSLAVTADRARIVTIAAQARAKEEGILAIGGMLPASAAYRDEARARLIALAAEGRLVVPIARTFPFEEAPAALELLSGGHPGGKLALVP